MRKPQPIHLFAIAVFLLLGIAGVGRHLGGDSHFYDLGVMDNIVWQTANGRFLYYPQYHMSFLGDHFSLVLLAFVPLYAVWAHPALLILGQAAGLAAAVVLVYRIATRLLGDAAARGLLEAPQVRRAAGIFAVLAAFHPSLLHVAMFDFHPVTFMIPLSLAAYLCYLDARRGRLALLLLLLLLCKEEAAFSVGAFGLYMVLFGRGRADRRFGLATAVVSGLYLVLVMRYLIPSFQPQAAEPGWIYVSRYGHLGSTMGEVMRTILLRPLDALVLSWRPFKLETLAWLLAPLGLLPLLGWRALLVALPTIGYSYLSGRTNQFVIQHQYFSPALPWLFVAAVQGLVAWCALWRHRTRWRLLPLVAALLALVAAERELHPIKTRYFAPRHPYRDQLREIHGIVGPDASISVTNRLAPTFAHRRGYYLALDCLFNRELNAALGLPDYHDTRFHLFDLTALDGSQDRERRVAALLADERYGVRYYEFPLVLFERGLRRSSPPELEALLAEAGDGESERSRTFPAIFLKRSDKRDVLSDLGDSGRGAALRFVPGRRGRALGPYVIVAAGRYEVDFHLRLERPGTGAVAELAIVSEYANTVHAAVEVAADELAPAGGADRPVTVAVTFDRETREVEFRTRSRGAALALRKVVLRRVGDAP